MSTARAERKIPMTPEEREAAFAEIDAIQEELREERERRARGWWARNRDAAAGIVVGALLGAALAAFGYLLARLAPKVGDLRWDAGMAAAAAVLIACPILAVWYAGRAAGRAGG